MTPPPRFAVDTSVAVPLLVAAHPQHAAVGRWAREKTLVLSGHALVETYSVLTRLPAGLRASGNQAAQLVHANFDGAVQPLPATLDAFPDRCAEAGVAGGAAYDALVALAAVDNDLPLATRDARASTTYTALGADTEILATPAAQDLGVDGP